MQGIEEFKCVRIIGEKQVKTINFMEKSTPLLIEWQSALTPYFWGWNAPTIKVHIGVKLVIESHSTVNPFAVGHLKLQRLLT